jgi:pteridine reductase
VQNNTTLSGKVALVTGAARRLGAVIARTLHANGMNLILHYRSSQQDAQQLQQELNSIRADSVVLIQADLLHTTKLASIVQKAEHVWGRLDVLVNNASSFFPTPIGSVDEHQWNDLIGTNLKAPFYLSQAAARALTSAKGCIINIVDVHAERPLKTFSVYSVAKAGLVMLTKALARELGPHVRVNAVAPGVILWPEKGIDDVTKQRIISRTALKREGSPKDVARAVLFLIRDADYTSGEVISVDGGRGLND